MLHYTMLMNPFIFNSNQSATIIFNTIYKILMLDIYTHYNKTTKLKKLNLKITLDNKVLKLKNSILYFRKFFKLLFLIFAF